MKIKVLFMIINMNVGGTEKALLNMISIMPRQEFEITIFMLEKSGGFLNYIPDWVHVKSFNDYHEIKSVINEPPLKVIKTLLKKANVFEAVLLFLIHVYSALTKERSLLYKYLLHKYPNEGEYDIAVAYAGPMDFISFFIANKVIAKKKIQWIHFDITKIGFNNKFSFKIFRRFDKIFVVSDEGKAKLINKLPSLNEKIETFKNIVSNVNIQGLANQGEGFKDNFNGIRILTVGRLSAEKGQDLIIPVLAKLKGEGFNIRWYCIGEGAAREEYENLIIRYGVEEDFILLGSNPNPYPFIKQCDIYVQPSRHEGYCITLTEAKYFNKPIVSTNFTGANEQLNQNETGMIVEVNSKDIYLAVKKLLTDKSLQIKFTKNLENESDSRTNNHFKIVDL
ncbi:glycosyltransferase [Mesobacillus foraminis]|uniref:glycosyltransferase n=1 Tax=Mesobacillus foraminis TaxID=279826 RepID=UPI001BE57A5A|nr:glycosyltransferase [Mesobacillus foraminis]MBT2758406.1 glycosyltransferase [Mesobacillus foraminis]